jgi:hypothetical protein
MRTKNAGRVALHTTLACYKTVQAGTTSIRFVRTCSRYKYLLGVFLLRSEYMYKYLYLPENPEQVWAATCTCTLLYLCLYVVLTRVPEYCRRKSFTLLSKKKQTSQNFLCLTFSSKFNAQRFHLVKKSDFEKSKKRNQLMNVFIISFLTDCNTHQRSSLIFYQPTLVRDSRSDYLNRQIET